MKHKRMMFIGLLLIIVECSFADELKMMGFRIAPGETRNIEMTLENPDHQYIMIEFWMKLPDGVIIDRDDKGNLFCEGNAVRFNPTHQLVVREVGSNSYHFLIYSNQKEPLLGMTGALLSIRVKASESATLGVHSGMIINQLFCDTEKNEYTPIDISFDVTVGLANEQTLSLESIPNMTYGDSDNKLPVVTAQELPIEWSINDSTVASLENGSLSINNVGSTTVTAYQKGNEYYLPFNKQFTLTINKAMLTITANDVSRLYYDKNPDFTYTCEGYQYGDTDEMLIEKPTLNTIATKNSNAGSYPITIEGAKADNYDIIYKSGMLFINKRELMVSTNDYSRYYNEENPIFELTYIGFVENEDETDLVMKPTATTEATKKTDVGVYDIIIDGGEAINYEFVYSSGKLTIEKAYQTLSWEQDLSNLKLYDQVQLLAEASSGLKVSYYVVAPDICSIINIGEKTYLDCSNEGETIIYALQDGNKNYWQTNKEYKTVKICNPVSVNIDKSRRLQCVSSGVSVCDLQGRKIGTDMQQANGCKSGVHIIRLADGTTRKVVVK